jgi:hypothetical protein
MKTIERERHDWIMIPILLVIGFLFVMVAGQWALRFSPHWQLDASMESNLDPNSDFLTGKPNGFIEPVDPSILTQPGWINVFLTPGAEIPPGTPIPATADASLLTSSGTQTPFKTITPTSIGSVTNTAIVILNPTNTSIYYPPTLFHTDQTIHPPSRPQHTFVSIDTLTSLLQQLLPQRQLYPLPHGRQHHHTRSAGDCSPINTPLLKWSGFDSTW